MKKRILLMMSAAVLAVSALSLSSCTKDENTYITQGTVMFSEEIDVHPGDWVWNPIYLRYEAVKPNNNISWYMYNKGAVQAGLFLTEGDLETLKSLPFIQPFSAGVMSTISFDITQGEMAFYYQLSNGAQPTLLPGGMTFKVTYFED